MNNVGIKALPPEYRWLADEDSPAIFREALKLYGVEEIKGAKSNPIIMGWALEVKEFLGAEYDNDDTAWCGLFMAVCAKRAGYNPPKVCVRAKSWLKFGTHVELSEAKFGDVLVFDRANGGHVGIYVGEDVECYHVLGGNQRNKVRIDRLLKYRLIATRRCPWRIAQPWNVRKIYLDAKGRISENEA